MRKFSYFLKQKHILILLGIILVALFFRTYDLYGRFEYAHDADLYGWIVKDVVVNHHIRLIGQQTSAPGIFIGPFFYYSLIPFFFITNMYPTGGLVLATTVGILTLISIYYVFRKLFNPTVGLIGAFLDAVLLQAVQFDRWVVPTIYTRIWAVWYLYCLIQITRGRLFVLPILGLLIGFIWHVHIALLPTLIALPLAFIFGKKLPTIKQTIWFFIAAFIPSIPLLIFETRHGFQQTLAFIDNFISDHGGSVGNYKLDLVMTMIGKNIQTFFLSPESLFPAYFEIWFFIFLALGIIPVLKKIMSWKELLVLYSWILGLVVFFTISSSKISEYYFASLEIIFLMIFCLILFLIFKTNKISKILVLILMGIIFVKNIYHFTNDYIYKKHYAEKKALVDVIKADSIKNKYPCVGISYITAQGENVGFRYLLWRENIHTNPPSLDIPVYNIVIPDELSKNELTHKFEHIGLIVPKNTFSQEKLSNTCSSTNSNTIDSMFGYVE